MLCINKYKYIKIAAIAEYITVERKSFCLLGFWGKKRKKRKKKAMPSPSQNGKVQYQMNCASRELHIYRDK